VLVVVLWRGADEPTSGLDSTTTLTLVNGLKEMARLGTTILVILHQPSVKVRSVGATGAQA
jgi:ABC-type multidrug transport system ATPase subunit